MASAQNKLPATQAALQWVKVSETDPFQWTTSAPVLQPSQLGDEQVLIENHAVSLNPVDYKLTAGNFVKATLPSGTGYDVSGRVVAVGKNVRDFQVGDEVFGMLNFKTNNGGGGFQQYSVGDVDTLIKKPSNISHADAATLGIAFISAMDGLRQVKIDSSTTVFVPGGSGGVGHFSVQIAQIRGAKEVITSASKEDGIRILREQYKVKNVIDHGKEDVVERVVALTSGEGVDVVYDSTYLPSSFEKSTKTVKAGGSWIVLGQYGQKDSAEAKSVAERKANLVHADLARYWIGAEENQRKAFIQESLSQGVKWVGEGKLKPYISRTIKLEEVEKALNELKGKGGFGKIVVKIV